MWKQSKFKTFCNRVVTVVLFSLPMASFAAEPTSMSGTPKDNAYAQKVWDYMKDNHLLGKGRMRSFPFVGSRPHGSVQEVLTTVAEIDGHKGRLIVKHNYGAKEGLTPHSVYTADSEQDYVALTIMFQREDGYDSKNNNWFWAEYEADSTLIKYQGIDLSGRAPACLGCHTPLGGNDREILNGRDR